jgi:hypothetical protein
MTTDAVRSFLPILREVERGLSVPIPERVRILRELEFDLEELRNRFMAQGLPAEEARIRALEALVPDGTALEELGRLHAPTYLRITRHMSEDRLRIMERSALGLSTISVLLGATLGLSRVDLLRDPSPFLWPVLGLGALLFMALIAKAFGLWIKGDHRRPDSGLGGILALAGATLATGTSGVLFDFYRLAEILERSPHLGEELVRQWLVSDSSLLLVSILIALAGGLFWFILTQWLTLVSGAHREVLGLGPIEGRQKEIRS